MNAPIPVWMSPGYMKTVKKTEKKQWLSSRTFYNFTQSE